MSDPHKVAHIRKTCFACPAQWEGATADGLYVYIRYRWGRLSAEVGNETVFSRLIGDHLAGYMEEHEVQKHLAGVLDFSEVPDFDC